MASLSAPSDRRASSSSCWCGFRLAVSPGEFIANGTIPLGEAGLKDPARQIVAGPEIRRAVFVTGVPLAGARRYSSRMMHALLRHPHSPSQEVARIEVGLARPRPAALTLRYVLSGHIADLAIPAPAPSRRADELWRHTCFEAFLRPEDGPEHGEAYFELNLAPSTAVGGLSPERLSGRPDSSRRNRRAAPRRRTKRRAADPDRDDRPLRRP